MSWTIWLARHGHGYRQLSAARWLVQSQASLNLSAGAGAGVAVCEFTLEKPHGRVDYLLFLNGHGLAIVRGVSWPETVARAAHTGAMSDEDEVTRIESLPAPEIRTPAQDQDAQRNWQSVLLNDGNIAAAKAVGGAVGAIAGKVILDKIKGDKGSPPNAGQDTGKGGSDSE